MVPGFPKTKKEKGTDGDSGGAWRERRIQERWLVDGDSRGTWRERIIQERWFVEDERPHRLDPRRALCFYIERTREFQVDDQLFIGYVGKRKGKAVHKRTLCRCRALVPVLLTSRRPSEKEPTMY
ncbi:hypothetical protein NDU88_012000 [Pleurodeles waltl]|uniref:Uncharacterized protein n=1 Tax=Pleurodeles waltl TaxID=8319 RepID=A0AAV7R507_PLEWA|nr:hypothetical protein NDU88_012000 [Pleurodeles waltl]